MRKLLASERALGRLVCTATVGAALFGCALPQAASAGSGFSRSRTHPPYSACPDPTAGGPLCEAIVVPTVASSSAEAVGPEFQAGGINGGFDPEELQEAYGLKAGGSGQTVAIVDQGNDIYAESDLQKYREEYDVYIKGSETACTEATGCFKKIDTNGETEAEAKANGKSFAEETTDVRETSLDIDMVAAACSECHILLVEAFGNPEKQTVPEALEHLLPAEEEAYTYDKHEATEISNSWDVWEGELSEAEQKADDERYFDHPGVPTTVSSGDWGYTGKLRWPGSSQYVISVGATKLTKVEKLKEGERGWAEEAWREPGIPAGERGSGTTSGCSMYEPKPLWQKDREGAKDKEGCNHRTASDVASVGSCKTPVSVYDHYEGWYINCGTSAAAPFVAGVEALSTHHSRQIGAEAFYRAGEEGELTDITKGGNGECGDLTGEAFTECHAKHGYESSAECGAPETNKYYLCHAEVGYDGPAGWGAPRGPLTLTGGVPTVATEPANAITDVGGTLNGTVNPEGAETKYYFEYGKTSSYGSKTAEASAGAGEVTLVEHAAITGLEPEVTYHYRVVAVNSFGTSDGPDHTFATTAPSWSIEAGAKLPGAEEGLLDTTSCSSSTACTAVGEYVNGEGVYVPLAERWNGTEWYVQSTPNPATGTHASYLQGVSCASATECMAAGGYYNSEAKLVGLAELWNGAEWKLESVPSPTGAKATVIHAVSCKTATECTAVGRYETSEGVYETLAERWNGSEWKVQTTPNPSGAKESLLKGISCVSSSWCTADGSYESSGEVTETLAEVWNGTEWKTQTTPNPSGALESDLGGVSCASSTACEANGWDYDNAGVEVTLAEVWNGTEWKTQTTPNPSGAKASALAGISCSSSSECFASGTSENSEGKYVALSEHWNGTEWGLQTTPDPSGAKDTYLQAASCTTGSACTASGYYENAASDRATLAERWNGTEWAIQSTPAPTKAEGTILYRVSCSTASACTAVGEYRVVSEYEDTEPVYAALAERWNGTEWYAQYVPIPSGAPESYLQGISCASATACMATGGYYTGEGKLTSLAESWNGTEWKIDTVPNPSGAKASVLHVVSCKTATECTAAGSYESSGGVYETLAERWNGSEWKVQTTPNPSGAKESLFKGVSCASSTSCLADGYYKNSEGVYETLSEMWSGSEWKIESTPDPGTKGNYLSGVSCTSSTACEANGWYYDTAGAEMTLAQVWNGKEWKTQTTPNPAGAVFSILDGVSCYSSTNCTASGVYANSVDNLVTLAEHWNGVEWKVQATANPSGATTSELEGLSCTSVTVCTATGLYVKSRDEALAEKSS
jgi:hypothetical protein